MLLLLTSFQLRVVFSILVITNTSKQYDALTQTKLQYDALTQTKLQYDALTQYKLQNDALTQTKLQIDKVCSRTNIVQDYYYVLAVNEKWREITHWQYLKICREFI